MTIEYIDEDGAIQSIPEKPERKKWTREEMEDIIYFATEAAHLYGIPYEQGMYWTFLSKANGDPEEAFKDFLMFAEQFFNKTFRGRPKPKDELSEELQVIQNFISSLTKNKKPTWLRFEKYCNGKTPFGRSAFYERLKKIKED